MKFRIHRVFTGMMGSNAYFLSDEEGRACVIDPGMGNAAADYAQKNGLKIELVLLTHGHFDHIGGCAAAKRRGIPVGCAAAEESLIAAQPAFAAQLGLRVPPFAPDFTFSGGDSLAYGGLTFRVLATPGHTPGGVCFACGGALFTGDTLFAGSVGRTDLPGGSAAALRASLRMLFALEGDYTVYPGHDTATTLAYERKYNPFAE